MTSSLVKTDLDGNAVEGFAKIYTNDHILSVEELDDGKLLIAGWFDEILWSRYGGFT